MRNYQLYIIKDEFASHFFGRERMFFQLFTEYANATGEHAEILNKQVEYITRNIPMIKVQQILKRKLAKRCDFHLQRDSYTIEMVDIVSRAQMCVSDRYLHLQSAGTFDAETIFFEVLRQWEANFIALDLKNERYGWLKPIKDRKFSLNKEKQILYNNVSFSTL